MPHLALVLICLFFATEVVGQQVWHVDQDATPNGNGLSWKTAFQNPASAFAIAQPDDEVWIAEGTYRPPGDAGDRTRAFVPPPDVAVYGGFAGNELDRAQRDWTMHHTIFDGDLDEDDGPNFENYDDNCFNVVRQIMVPDGLTIRLDGLRIRGGAATETFAPYWEGGGIHLNVHDETTTLIVSNCELYENLGRSGAGIRTRRGSLLITDSILRNNQTTTAGGAGGHLGSSFVEVMRTTVTENTSQFTGGGLIIGSYRDCVVRDSVFSANMAGEDFPQDAAGLLLSNPLTNLATALIDNSRFEHNMASHRGGAVGTNGLRRVTIRRCTFVNNFAVEGGALNLDTDEATIESCRFVQNMSQFDAGAIRTDGTDVFTCVNSEFIGNMSGRDGGALVIASTVDNGRIIANCSFVHNTAGDQGGAVMCDDLSFANSIFWGNDSAKGKEDERQVFLLSSEVRFDYCLMQGWTGNFQGMGSFDADPLFVNPLGFDGVPGTLDDDLRLRPQSPCIDAGVFKLLPKGTDFDLAGEPRLYDGDGDGTPEIDLGPLEWNGPPAGSNRLRSGNVGGSSPKIPQ